LFFTVFAEIEKEHIPINELKPRGHLLFIGINEKAGG
jgi:hypothetical protein